MVTVFGLLRINVCHYAIEGLGRVKGVSVLNCELFKYLTTMISVCIHIRSEI